MCGGAAGDLDFPAKGIAILFLNINIKSV